MRGLVSTPQHSVQHAALASVACLGMQMVLEEECITKTPEGNLRMGKVFDKTSNTCVLDFYEVDNGQLINRVYTNLDTKSKRAAARKWEAIEYLSNKKPLEFNGKPESDAKEHTLTFRYKRNLKKAPALPRIESL